MFELQGSQHSPFCDRSSRRDFLRLGSLALGGLTLSNALRVRAASGQEAKPKSWGKAGILIWLAGGPSQIETFDPKPDAPVDYRGPFKTISTKVPGMQVCEIFPKLATIADKYSLVRSCCHENSGHGGGQRWAMTGYDSRSPEFELPHDFPNVGSVVARMRGPNRKGMPSFTAFPPSNLHNQGAAYLGAAYNPLQVYSNGRPTELTLDPVVKAARLNDRRQLRMQLDRMRRDGDRAGLMDSMDALEAQALDLVTGNAAQAALDPSKEPAAMRERYGNSDLGKCCLLARRAVEAGTTFVTVSMGAWDQHGAAGGTIHEKYLEYAPQVDQAVTTLIEDLDDRGLLDDTVIYLLGEFGRTPRMNNTGGRDHWPQAMSILMTGGGLQRGQIVGATNSKGEFPTERVLAPADVLATVYHTLGIDYRREFMNSEGRPVQLLAEGRPIRELV